ncbi:MAG TPA: translocation/assembly module TamB domain-containing protein, partial [Rubrivivax sp.]|nr:translocation/assembly module TamB domain-containing protein [Rubrivivax sp.]
MQEPSPANPPQARARPVRTTLGLFLPLAIVVGLLILVLALLAGGARWALLSDEGTLWLLQRLPMVQVKGFKGAALGGQWRADSLRVEWDGGRQWLLLEDLAADGLQWQWRPSAHAWLGLRGKRVVARKVTVDTGPPSGQPLVLPQSIAAPLHLALDEVRVQEVRVNALSPILQVALNNLVLDAQAGAQHRVDQLSAVGLGITLDGGLKIVNTKPFVLDARAAIRPTADGDMPRWGAVLQAAGSVEEMQLNGTLRGRAAAGREAPSVDLRAALRPLQAWPLAALKLQTEALDLSALINKAPATRLSGEADVTGGEAGKPLRAALRLANGMPGLWNEGRLPVGQLTLEVNGQLDHRDRIEFSRFEVQLADATRNAGRVLGSAVWAGHQLEIDTRLDGVTPQRLDGRAAAMLLSGPLTAKFQGLPLPFAQAPTAAKPKPPAAHASWKLDLQGQLDAAPQPVRVLLEGSADANHFELSNAQAQSGAATVQLKALLRRAVAGRPSDWSLTTTGSVVDFDPLPWWPGDSSPAWRDWRKGQHRISGGWQFDVLLPSDASRLPTLALAQRAAGNGSLRIRESMLGGVPLTAEANLSFKPDTGPAPATLQAEVLLGGNQLTVQGRANPAGEGHADRWQAELKAETLATWAPLMRLFPAWDGWAPRQGSATASIALDGRWPRLRSEGSARVTQLQTSNATVSRASAGWRLDMVAEQPAAQTVSAQVEVAGLVWDKQRADHIRADVRGTLAEHRIEVSGALPIAPPLVAEQMLGLRSQSGTRALLVGRGNWLPTTATGSTGGGRWRTHVERLVLGGWDGSVSAEGRTEPPAAGWAELRDLRGEVLLGADWQLQQLLADAGRLRVGDSLALRWEAIDIDLRGAQPQVQLRAQVEPFALAPLLARAQPTIGWTGDLKLAARFDVRAAAKVDADIVFERTEGDLQVQTGDGTRALGVTEARLALVAHEGVWLFTPRLRGRNLGDLGGRLQVRTTPDRRWPHADAPVEGSLQAQVADIGIWGAWVPAGWRLAGNVSGTAGVSGRFGAPQYSGEVNGSGLAVRNLLQGVNINEGNVAIKLQGDTAQIERFSLRGGDGVLSVTGGATLGKKPQAKLQFAAERFRVLGRVDRLIVASGKAELALSPDGGRLDGKLRIEEGLIDASRADAPSLDDDVNVRLAGSPPPEPADPNAPNVRRNFVLATEVDLGDNLRVRGRGLNTMLRGLLRLSTPSGRFAVNGSITAAGGT